MFKIVPAGQTVEHGFFIEHALRGHIPKWVSFGMIFGDHLWLLRFRTMWFPVRYSHTVTTRRKPLVRDADLRW